MAVKKTYVVSKGKSVTSAKGIKGSGEKITAEDIGNEAAFNFLVDKKLVVEQKKADK